MIGIIDYKAGNIQSVKNAFERLGAEVAVVSSPEELKNCDALVLPGVGSFSCIKELEGIKEELINQIENGKPFLESHHIVWLSKGGEDTVENSTALCPNCHRKMHMLNLRRDIKKLKAAVVKTSK